MNLDNSCLCWTFLGEHWPCIMEISVFVEHLLRNSGISWLFSRRKSVMLNVLLLQENTVHMHFLLFQKFEDSAVYSRIATTTDRWLCTTLTTFSGSLAHSSAVLGCIGCNEVLSKVHNSYLDGLFQARHNVDDLWTFMTSGCWWNEISPDLPEVRALAVHNKVSATCLCKQAIKSYPWTATINSLAFDLLGFQEKDNKRRKSLKGMWESIQKCH